MNTITRNFFAAALFGTATLTNASHSSFIGSIDSIDHVFASGGGTATGSLSNGTDDDWLTFNATAGDNISIMIRTSNWFVNAVLLQDTGNGVFSVGDTVGVANFNNNNVGLGSPLQILSHIGALEFNSSGSLNWTAGYTGEYGIAINSANESSGLNWTVNLSGNTGNNSPVPDSGSSLAMLALALCGGVVGRRKLSFA